MYQTTMPVANLYVNKIFACLWSHDGSARSTPMTNTARQLAEMGNVDKMLNECYVWTTQEVPGRSFRRHTCPRAKCVKILENWKKQLGVSVEGCLPLQGTEIVRTTKNHNTQLFERFYATKSFCSNSPSHIQMLFKYNHFYHILYIVYRLCTKWWEIQKIAVQETQCLDFLIFQSATPD